MLAIRLFRTGKKNQPFYKIVVTDKKNAPHRGRFTESLGYLNPLTKEVKLNGERAKYWISVGAKPSDTIHNLLIKKGVIKGKKIALHQEKPVKEGDKKEEPKKEEVVKVEKVSEAPKEEEVKTEEKQEEKPTEKEEPKKEEKVEEKIEEVKAEEKVEEKKEEKVEEDASK